MYRCMVGDRQGFNHSVDALRWQRVDSVFQAVLEMSPEEREQYLAELREDPEVCREVLDLLRADGQADQFLESAALRLPVLERLAGPTLSPGMVLSERFRLVRFLAEGGMGEVYEAEDLELGDRVAVKIVRPDVAMDRKVMLRFRREVHLARQVTHPSVCRCFDIFRHTPPDDGVAGPEAAPGPLTFLTMELIRGQTLAAWLRGKGALATAQALPILEQVAAALAAAHERGIVHRDLKPSNVMVDDAGPALRVVVTDFGLALTPAAAADGSEDDTRPALGRSLRGRRAQVSITGRGQVLGTPAYMAPEQILGARVSPATDIYAMGVLMYQMVTGRAPFEAEDEGALALMRLSEPAPSPRSHVPDLDPRWERTILRCLERSSERRFASTHDVLASLRGPAPRVRRNRGWMAAAIIAAITVVSAAAMMTRDPPTGPHADLVAAEQAEAEANHRLALARAEQAARGAEALGDTRLRADALYRVARARWRLQSHAQALASAQEAEALYRSLGDREGEARAVASQADVLDAQGLPDQATSMYERALASFEALGHTAGMVDVHINLAPLLARGGHTDRAVDLLERAHSMARDIGDGHGDGDREARALFNLAWIHHKRDQLDRARPLYTQALALAREHGIPDIESGALNNLASVLRMQGELEAAESRYWEALSIARALGDDEAVSSRLSNLALTLRLTGNLDRALTQLEEALAVAERLGDHARVAQRLTHMATILRMQGRLDQAGAALDRAMMVHQRVDAPRGRASTLRCLGLLRLAEGNRAEARRLFDEALAVREQLQEGTAELLLVQRARALLAMEEGHLDEAERMARAIIDEHVALGRQDEELEDRLLLARILLRHGRVSEARRAMERAGSLARGSQDHERRLRTRLVAAEVDAAWHGGAGALAALDAVAQAARESMLVELALEARLAHAALAGQQDAAEAAIRDAEAHGFVALANHARALEGAD